MKTEIKLAHKFVEFIPDSIEERTLYISIEYRTAMHKCICGCGNEVVTPISPTDWEFTFDGETISLSPSIGNWNFECRSHYWIRNSRIVHSRSWSKDEVDYGRKNDEKKKRRFFSKKNKGSSGDSKLD